MGEIGYGVDWNEGQVRLVALSREASGYRLVARASADLTGSTGDPGPLGSWLAKERIRPRRSLVSLTGSGLVLRYTRLPRMEDWKLRRLMEMEIEEFTAKSESKVVYDYGILNVPSREIDRFLMLVAMAKDAEIQESFGLLRRGGIAPSAMVPSPLALYNSFLKFGETGAKGIVGLVELSARSLHFVLLKESTLYFARNVAGGLDLFVDSVRDALSLSPESALALIEEKGDITPGSRGDHALTVALLSAAGQVLNSIESNLKFARGQLGISNLELGRIYLAGGALRIRGLSEYLMKSLSRTVSPFLPEADLALPEGSSSADLAGYEVALGLAQMACDPSSYRLILVPEGEKKRKLFLQETLFQYLAIGALILVFAALITMRIERAGRFRDAAKSFQATLERADELEARLEDARREGEASRRKLTILASAARSGAEFDRLLSILKEETPEHVFTLSVDLESRKNSQASGGEAGPIETVYSVTGVVEEVLQDVEAVLRDYLGRLARRPEFAQCKLQSSRMDEEKGVLQFQIEISFVAREEAP